MGAADYNKSRVSEYATPVLYRTLLAALEDAATAYATAHPEVLQQGAEDHRTRTLSHLNYERAELVKKLADIDAQIAEVG